MKVGWRSLLDLVLPPHCPSCERVVDRDGAFCAPCFGRLRFIIDPCCRFCAVPFPDAATAPPERACEACALAPPPWTAAGAALRYDDGGRALVLPLKYADRTENARVLGRWMARSGAHLLDGADWLVPVPLHRARLRARRYNQAALLACAVRRARNGEGPGLLLDGLRRTRATRALAHQARRARAAEMAGAISVTPARAISVRGRRIVLVDDVLTTGATARECTDALLASGAASVALLVATRTARPC